ncbi:hypothetical protein [Streptomyces sp. B4I13]|uniref:hypothetical protein n=1 Tax=Streptomyces sp. B4I13 TaxID=3042271 RepID=UPI0027D91443|nr:hypothetical protein [Streptomyces sp. B4I13]
MLEPQSGVVLVGGAPVRSPVRDPLADAHALSGSRVPIPQEACVFTGTPRENLSSLCPTATPADLDSPVDAVGAGPHRAPGRLRRAGGPALVAAGERQLIALVRALPPPPGCSCWARPPAISTSS